jgi:hypothetical protein
VKYAEGPNDIKYLTKILEDLSESKKEGYLIKVFLFNGSVFEGFITGESLGSIEGKGSSSRKYYGVLKLLSFNKKEFEFNFLEIKGFENATTKENLMIYEKMGVVNLISYPN